jgi:hypothetical protein
LLLQVLRDGREWRDDVAGLDDVGRSDDRDLLRHCHAAVDERRHRAERYGIVVSDDRIEIERAIVEQRPHRGPRFLEIDGLRDIARIERNSAHRERVAKPEPPLVGRDLRLRFAEKRDATARVNVGEMVDGLLDAAPFVDAHRWDARERSRHRGDGQRLSLFAKSFERSLAEHAGERSGEDDVTVDIASPDEGIEILSHSLELETNDAPAARPNGLDDTSHDAARIGIRSETARDDADSNSGRWHRSAGPFLHCHSLSSNRADGRGWTPVDVRQPDRYRPFGAARHSTLPLRL